MPFGIHKHSNRSSKALNVQAQGSESSGSASFASGTDETRSNQPQAYQQQHSQQRAQQQYAAAPQGSGSLTGSDLDRGTYQKPGQQSPIPSRSQSTRQGSSYPQQQHLVQAGASADNLALDTRRSQKQQQQSSQTLQSPVEPKKKSLFDRMRSSRVPQQTQQVSSEPQSSYNNTSGLARRLSKRSENPPIIRTSQQRNSIDQQSHGDWQSPHRSELPSPQEGVEDDTTGLDPYLVTEPEQEEPRSAVQEQNQQLPQQTIRAVRNDSDPGYPATDEGRQHYHQQSHSQGHQQIQQQFDPPPQSQYQTPQQNHSQQLNTQPDSLGIIHDHYRQQNAETVSQLSYDSPIELPPSLDQRPVSVQSNNNSPTGGHNNLRQEYPNRTTSIIQGPSQGPIQGSRPLSQYTMPPPPTGASQPTRRPGDSKQTMQGNQGAPDSRDGPPPGYRQQFPPGGTTPTTGPGQSPIPPVVGNQGPNYRGGPPQREQYGPTGGGDQGRSTPPPAPGDRDVNDAYKELLQKYKKVKGLYFDKTAQVEQLQNTLANQRLSQSRTSLDDSEYISRFNRLDGATTNLAFNIRKDWRTLPNWLAPYVNQEALKVGKQEMTAVGRACISRFLMEEVFNKTFHPGLEGEFSTSLKNIEQNIRRFSPLLNNQEESDALTAKVVQWRLATLEGLREVLSSPESENYRKEFSQLATTKLTANLITYLGEPVPAGIEDSAHMIVELAVSIASNLPLESRDIAIVYPMPGDLLQPFIMKVESGSGMPLLENPGVDTSSEVDASSTGSGDKDEAQKENEKDGKNRKDKPKSGAGMLQSIMGGNAGASKLSKATQAAAEQAEAKAKVSSEDGPQKVRFAGFVGVEVRGRQMLMKAPVWVVG